MDATGPLACAFRIARERIAPGRDVIWEGKHQVDRVIVTKTRGTISVPPPDPAVAGKPVLARAGLPPGFTHKGLRSYARGGYGDVGAPRSPD